MTLVLDNDAVLGGGDVSDHGRKVFNSSCTPAPSMPASQWTVPDEWRYPSRSMPATSRRPKMAEASSGGKRDDVDVLCVLYDDPLTAIRRSTRAMRSNDSALPDGQTTPTPHEIDFSPGELLGCVSGELGLRKFLEAAGHELIVTSDKDGPDSEFEKALPRPRS